MVEMVKTVFHGILIGLANIIPGVSGGTLALILGIYQRLIRAIHNVDVAFVKNSLGILTFKKEAFAKFKEELKRIDAAFLGLIAAGALGAIVITARFMKMLLTEQHDSTYAFFFGLVLCSIVFPYKYLKRRSWKEVVSCIVAAVLTVGLTTMVTDERKVEKEQEKLRLDQQKEATATAGIVEGGCVEDAAKKSFISMEHPGGKRLAFLFLAASLAISAMVLPGVSGSFVLLLMGGYFDVLLAVNERQVIVLGIFALGCVAGLLVFSRIMNIMLEKFYNVTMAFMIGLMIGSLYELWPFRGIATVGEKVIYLSPAMPTAFGKGEIISLVTFLAGFALILVFVFLDKGEDASGQV